MDARRRCITITDYGPGIARDLQEQIFDRFVRIPTGDGDRPRGWGLGLYFARTLLIAQGGALTLQSPIHADPMTPGSCFVVKLSIAEEPMANEADDDAGVAASVAFRVEVPKKDEYKEGGVDDGATDAD